MGLSRALGVNLPLMSLFDFCDVNVSVIKNDYYVQIDRALENRFRINLDVETIYVDFDDCLIIDNKVNTSLVKFLYQGINQKKKIILLSKHDGELEKALEAFRLNELFDEIIHIGKDKVKSDYITSKKSIFIDDSFLERKNVKEKTGINVFSPDMLENLEIINE